MTNYLQDKLYFSSNLMLSSKHCCVKVQPVRAVSLAFTLYLVGSNLLRLTLNLLRLSKEINHLILKTCKPTLRLFKTNSSESVLQRKCLNHSPSLHWLISKTFRVPVALRLNSTKRTCSSDLRTMKIWLAHDKKYTHCNLLDRELSVLLLLLGISPETMKSVSRFMST